MMVMGMVVVKMISFVFCESQVQVEVPRSRTGRVGEWKEQPSFYGRGWDSSRISSSLSSSQSSSSSSSSSSSPSCLVGTAGAFSSKAHWGRWRGTGQGEICKDLQWVLLMYYKYLLVVRITEIREKWDDEDQKVNTKLMILQLDRKDNDEYRVKIKATRYYCSGEVHGPEGGHSSRPPVPSVTTHVIKVTKNLNY